MPSNGYVQEAEAFQAPPQDAGAERAVVGSVLISPSVLRLLDGVLRPDAFLTPAYRDIYSASLALYREGLGIDARTLKLELQRMGSKVGREEIVEAAVSQPTAAHVETYAAIVNEMDTRRRMISACQRGAELSWNLSVKLEAAKAQSLAGVQAAVMHNADGKRGNDAGSYVAKYREALRRNEPRLLVGKGTPWNVLDRMTLGLAPGYVYYQAARPQVGKSVLIHQLALHFMRNHGPVYLATLEMGLDSITERMLAMMTGIQRTKLALLKLDDQERHQVDVASSQLEKLFDERLRYCLAGATIERLASDVMRTQAEIGPLSLVLIDYLQLVDTDYSQGNREREVAHVSQQVKVMAERVGVPVWAAVQVTRDAVKRGGDGVPELHDLRESGSLEQDADYVLALHRDGPNVPPGKEKYHGEALLTVLKDRHYGKAGVSDRLRWQVKGERYTDREVRYDDVPFDSGETD